MQFPHKITLNVEMRRVPDGEWWTVQSPEFPGLLACAKTFSEVVQYVPEAITDLQRADAFMRGDSIAKN